MFVFILVFFRKYLPTEAIPPPPMKTVLQPSPYSGMAYCSDLTYLRKTPCGKDMVAGGDTAI